VSQHAWKYVCDEYYDVMIGKRLVRYECEKCKETMNSYSDPSGLVVEKANGDCDETIVKRVMEK
jgi:hypothetical protein